MSLKFAALFATTQWHEGRNISVKGHQSRCHALINAAKSLGYSGQTFPDFMGEVSLVAKYEPDVVFYDGWYEYIKLNIPGKKVAIIDVPAKASDNMLVDLFLFPTPGKVAVKGVYIMDFMITSDVRPEMCGAWTYEPGRKRALFIERGNPDAFWRYVEPIKTQCLLHGMTVDVVEQHRTIPHLVLLNRMMDASVVVTTASVTAKEAIYLGVPTIVTATHESQNAVMQYILDHGLGSSAFDAKAVPAALAGENLLTKEIIGSFMTPTEIIEGIVNAFQLGQRKRKKVVA